MAHWYYGNQNMQVGPLDDAAIRMEISRGVVRPETLVWREGFPSWLPMAHVQEFSQPVPYQAPPVYYPVVQTSGNATASLVTALVGLVCFPPIGLMAVIFGHLALKQIKESPLPMGGQGLAIAGLILGYLQLAGCLFFAVMLVISVSM